MRFAISSKGVAIAVALACLLLTTAAHGDGVRFRTPVTCTARPSGNTIDLAPGRYISEPEWLQLDGGTIKLQNDVTRLRAENAALRKPDPTNWKLVLAAALVGIAAGSYAFRD